MTIIRFTTTPEFYSIELWMEENAFTQTILPAFNQIFLTGLPNQFTEQELKQFVEILENDIHKRLNNYKPSEIGNQFPIKIFEKEYLLAILMNKDHGTLYTLNNLYESLEDSLNKKQTVHITYPYQDK